MLGVISRRVLEGWRKIAKNRDLWKPILKKARVLRGQYSQLRERDIVKQYGTYEIHEYRRSKGGDEEELVVANVALEQVLLRKFRIFPITIRLPILRIHLSSRYGRHTSLSINGVIKHHTSKNTSLYLNPQRKLCWLLIKHR
jgi:hypothetical protein